MTDEEIRKWAWRSRVDDAGQTLRSFGAALLRSQAESGKYGTWVMERLRAEADRLEKGGK